MSLLFKSFSKEVRLTALADAVKHCTICPRMSARTRVLSSANGNLNSKVVFIAEAPGRLGADRTAIPLYGDRTGDNFETLLKTIGWRREDVFISNAILCNPRNEDGNNGTPTPIEVQNCARLLKMTIELLQPELIIPLGAVALRSLDLIAPHGLTLKENVATINPWRNTFIFPMYHPAPRAMLHRSFANQTADFMKLSKLVNPTTGLKTRNHYTTTRHPHTAQTKNFSVVRQIICLLVNNLPSISFFKLMKLLYLVDFTSHKSCGQTITGLSYVREEQGPWTPVLKDFVSLLDGFEIRKRIKGQHLILEPGGIKRFRIDLPEENLEIISTVINKYREYDNTQIKTAVYLTSPMRTILRQEKLGTPMRGKVVLS